MELLDPLFGSEPVDRIFADRSRLQRMLDFEAALARAEARLGVIPENAAAPIAECCQASLFDLEVLSRSARAAGNLAIPMVKQLTALVEKTHADAAGYVHWGATSQDAIDTCLVLQLRDALAFIRDDLSQLCDRLVALCEQHRHSVVAGRTWLQHAVPTVFGLKVAGWLDALTRHRIRLQQLWPRVLVLQFGGAAGTLATLGRRGLEVAKALAAELRLELPATPWHTQRDRVAEVATTLALLTGTLGKMARDISLEMQTEVAEVFEPAGEGRGGSSTMPQKRNPVACAVVLAAAERVPGLTSTMLSAMSQEHERGLGGWHAEWETLPEIVRLAAGALRQMTETISGLEVDPKRMAENLEVTSGLIFAEAAALALAKHMGKSAAHQVLEAAARRATREQKHLREILNSEKQVTTYLQPAEMDELFDPRSYLGSADQFIDRAIAAGKKLSREAN
jgi:3-carboxy-cis,cis-muconate cycloisomerase